MAKTNVIRKFGDPVAIATKGRVTSQIRAQESSDKGRVLESDEDVPRTNETDEDVPRVLSTKT